MPGPCVALATLVLGVVVAYLLAYRRRPRRPMRNPIAGVAPAGAAASPPSAHAGVLAPELTLEERVGSALLQSMIRSGWAWMDGLVACPACKRSRATSSLKDRLAQARGLSSSLTPQPRPISVPASPPALPSGTFDEVRRRAGSLRFLAHDRSHVHRVGGPHYVSYTLDVSCDGCGLARSYSRSDGAAYPAYSIARLPTAAGPRRRWTLALRGAAIGTVLAGGGAPTDAEVGHGVSGDERFTVALARMLIDAAVMADLSPLPPEAQDAMRIEAVSRALPPFGAELLSTEECP